MTDTTLTTLAVLRKDYTEAQQKWVNAARSSTEDVSDMQYYLNLSKVDRLKRDADHKHKVYITAYRALTSKMSAWDREMFEMHW